MEEEKSLKSSKISIEQLFRLMVDNNASDLHIACGDPPRLRISGSLVKTKTDILTKEDTKRLIYKVLSERQRNEFEKNQELDFSFGIKGLGRFRANVFYSKGAVVGVFRAVPSNIPDIDQLGLPKVILDMINQPNGLVLVTGPTGSGKSTTLAALIDFINRNMPYHILTLEDPIEFVHQNKMSLVNQREIGTDSLKFSNSIKSLLRQDPDVVLIGEMRDSETIESALTIAETGHLVLGTLHTNSAIQTINRIINVFPSGKKDQIRALLSFVLQGIVSQKLIPKGFEQKGRICAMEVLFPNTAIRHLIRDNKIHQMYSQMQINQEATGMVTMNQNLHRLVDKGIIDVNTALLNSPFRDELEDILGIRKKK